jgi:hypothetical protein
VACGIKMCDKLAASGGDFCFACESLPCARLKRLDKRYREKYGMSMLENLERIRERGLDDFVAWERERWACTSCGCVVSVHRDDCAFCGEAKQ